MSPDLPHLPDLPDPSAESADLAARLAGGLGALDVATARPPVFPAADLSYAVHDTEVGRILLARKDSGEIAASLFVPDAAAEDAALIRLAAALSPRVLRQPARLDEARGQLDDYLAGRRQDFSLALDLTLARAFQGEVLTTLVHRVGYGRRATYGELARWAGRPGAARAVGAALGGNPLCVLLPCHRVVAATGALTGYAGGLAAKRFLLDLEAAGLTR